MIHDDSIPLDLLVKLPIFDNMTATERQQLVDISTTMDFTPGEIVLRQGKSSQNLWVVLEGKCQVIKQSTDSKGDILLAEFAEFDHFGDMSFFHDAPHSASVKATTKLRLLRIERRDYDALIREGSLAAYKLAYNIVDELADRLRKMDAWVSDLLGKESPDRQASEWSRFRDKLFNAWNL